MNYTWDTSCIIILRVMIGDVADPFTYSDERLRQLLLVGARFAITEVGFPTPYKVDLNAMTITPDPEMLQDNGMIVLSTLRAACFLDQAEMRQKAGSAVKISDNKSSIDTTPLVAGFQLLMSKGACANYEDARVQYLTGGLQSSVVGQAILSPFAIISSYGGMGYALTPNSPVGRDMFF